MQLPRDIGRLRRPPGRRAVCGVRDLRGTKGVGGAAGRTTAYQDWTIAVGGCPPATTRSNAHSVARLERASQLRASCMSAACPLLARCCLPAPGSQNMDQHPESTAGASPDCLGAWWRRGGGSSSSDGVHWTMVATTHLTSFAASQDRPSPPLLHGFASKPQRPASAAASASDASPRPRWAPSA